MTANNTSPEINPAADYPAGPGKKKSGLIVTLCVLCALVLAAAGTAAVILSGISNARSLLEQGEYQQAKAQFQKYSFIPSAAQMPAECDYAMASELMENGEFLKARDLFESISGYKDADDQADAACYAHACALFESGKYQEANEFFNWLGDYKDCRDMFLLSTYKLAEQHYDAGDFEQAGIIFTDLHDYEDAADRAVECRIAGGIQFYEQGNYPEAVSALEDYAGLSDDARVYLHLSNFEYYKAAGFSEFGVELFDALTLCSAYSEKAAEALLDPFFYYARCYGAKWECGRYYMDCRSHEGTTYYDLPWEQPEGSSMVDVVNGGRLEIRINGELWYSFDGFDSLDEKHPQEMYMSGSDGERYVFKRCAVYDQ